MLEIQRARAADAESWAGTSQDAKADGEGVGGAANYPLVRKVRLHSLRVAASAGDERSVDAIAW